MDGEVMDSTPPRHRSEEMKILNISCPRVGIEPTTCRVYSDTLVPLLRDWPYVSNNIAFQWV